MRQEVLGSKPDNKHTDIKPLMVCFLQDFWTLSRKSPRQKLEIICFKSMCISNRKCEDMSNCINAYFVRVYELHPFESLGVQVMIKISAEDVSVLKHMYTIYTPVTYSAYVTSL